MLIDFSVENFTSIKEKITFSLKSTSGKKLSKNIINNSSSSFPSLVKNAIVFGANASGKSNLIKSLFFIWEMVITSHQFNINTKIPRLPYKFDDKTMEKPSKFDINFIYNNIRYNYGFSCTDNKFTEEYLYQIVNNKRKLIFKRDKMNHFRFGKDSVKQKKYANQTIPNVLYVSRATQLGNEKTKPVFEFFSNSLHINSNPNLPSWRNYTLKRIYDQPEMMGKVVNLLQKFDFGGITDITIDREQSPIKQITFTGKDSMPSNIMESIEDTYGIKFIHKINGKLIKLELTEESSGTIKTFDLLGHILDTLEKGNILVVDELDSSLHPEVSQFILKLFTSQHNKNNAQLIFTTHNTSFLDSSLLRKDQIYFCEKEPNKATELHSMSDFDIRQDANFEKSYKEGRFGSVPFIDRSYID